MMGAAASNTHEAYGTVGGINWLSLVSDVLSVLSSHLMRLFTASEGSDSTTVSGSR